MNKSTNFSKFPLTVRNSGLVFHLDNERGVCYNYKYDAKGNVTKIVETDTNGNILATNTFVFDANERLTSKTYGAVGHTYRPVYEKNANGYIYPDNEILGITLDGKFTDKVTKDGLRRASAKTFQVGSRTLFSESYGYLSTPKDGKTIATEIVSSVASHVYGTSANSSTLGYTYGRTEITTYVSFHRLIILITKV